MSYSSLISLLSNNSNSYRNIAFSRVVVYKLLTPPIGPFYPFKCFYVLWQWYTCWCRYGQFTESETFENGHNDRKKLIVFFGLFSEPRVPIMPRIEEKIDLDTSSLDIYMKLLHVVQCLFSGALPYIDHDVVSRRI